MSAKNVMPTLFVNHHLGAAGDVWRPYVGVGINYTKFVSIKSRLAHDLKMSDSAGIAAKVGVDYRLSPQWG